MIRYKNTEEHKWYHLKIIDQSLSEIWSSVYTRIGVQLSSLSGAPLPNVAGFEIHIHPRDEADHTTAMTIRVLAIRPESQKTDFLSFSPLSYSPTNFHPNGELSCHFNQFLSLFNYCKSIPSTILPFTPATAPEVLLDSLRQCSASVSFLWLFMLTLCCSSFSFTLKLEVLGVHFFDFCNLCVTECFLVVNR